MKIAICDDELQFQKKLGDFLEKYGKENGIVMEMDFYMDGQELAGQKRKLSGYDVFFLDIDMQNLDGIRTAEIIREYTKEAYIIFFTAFLKYSPEGYRVNAIRYILKTSEDLEFLLKEGMDTILSNIKKGNLSHVFEFKEGKKKLLGKDICYVESDLHILRFHMADREEEYSIPGKLDEFQKMPVFHSFIRIHKSYLVNVDEIQSVKKYQVRLKNGTELGISRSRYRETEEAFVRNEGNF